MLGRAIGWGVALPILLILVWPAAAGLEANLYIEAVAAPASAELAVTQDQIKPQPENQTANQPAEPTANRAHDEARMPVRLSALDPAEPLIEAPALTEPFGHAADPIVSGTVLVQWSGVEADIRSDIENLDRCRAGMGHCSEAARKFLAVIAEARSQSGRARVGAINRAVNLAIRPMTDLAQWGVPDRWSSPLETFTTGRGDCEDYAIAKYVALTLAGIAEKDVRLIILHDLAVGENHAVVAVRLDDRWLVLDNRRMTMVVDVEVLHVVPLFLLDRGRVRQFVPDAMAGIRGASAYHRPKGIFEIRPAS